MLKEFKSFIMSGNVIDFAVAVIMATALGLVINGFVADIVMPVVGHFAGGYDFSDLRFILTAASGTEGSEGYVAENAIRYGAWINSIVNLIIVGAVMFMMVKAYNKTKAPVVEEEAGPTAEDLLAEIRDSLRK